eukprot:756718-Hanusia_phi.AAC.1
MVCLLSCCRESKDEEVCDFVDISHCLRRSLGCRVPSSGPIARSHLPPSDKTVQATRSALLETFSDSRGSSRHSEHRSIADRKRILRDFLRLESDVSPGHELAGRRGGGGGDYEGDEVGSREERRRSGYTREQQERSERAVGVLQRRSSRSSLEDALKRVLTKWVREGGDGTERARPQDMHEEARRTSPRGAGERERRGYGWGSEKEDGQRMLRAIAERIGMVENQRSAREEGKRARMAERRPE